MKSEWVDPSLCPCIYPVPISTPSPNPISRRAFLAGTAAVAGVVLYAGTHARHELEVTELPLRIRALGPGLAGLRIAQISDLHLEEYTEPAYLRRVVDRVNALRPDVVLLTGDFISRGPVRSVAFRAMPVCADVLAGLHCPTRFAILGNHDTDIGSRFVAGELERVSIPTLIDRHVALDRGGDRLWISGAKDPGTRHPDLNLAIPADPRAPVIFMAHEPDFVRQLLRHPRATAVDVMLSGHTHGGQIRLPLVGPLVLPPMGLHYVQGLFRPGGRLQLYVNRGIGTVGVPFRLNCPSEITLFTLQSSTQA